MNSQLSYGATGLQRYGATELPDISYCKGMLRIAVHCAQHILLILSVSFQESCTILMYLHHVLTLDILALELGVSGLGLGQNLGSAQNLKLPALKS